MLFDILIPGLILGGFALISSTGLLFASKKFHVDEDPRIEEVAELLPAANCGACGYTGCTAYAEHIVSKMDLNTPCPVADEESLQAIAELLNLEAPVGEKTVASLMCNGTDENAKLVMDYRGIRDCWAATLVADSTKACAYSCIGLGSCLPACNFDALHLKDGIIEVDEENCTGCGQCVSACPKNVLHMRPVSKTVTVTCSNFDKGPDVKKACAVVCFACQKCVKVCDDDAITVENSLAKIDYSKCTLCEKCIEECPTNAIQIKGAVTNA